MKSKKVVNMVSLLSNLDSNQLKVLKREFNSQFRESMEKLEIAEREEIATFINGLNLTSRWHNEDQNAVSLHTYRLNREKRQKLNEISNMISRGFSDLADLKVDVAEEAKRDGTPYYKVFKTSVRRMNKHKEANPYRYNR